MPVRNIADKELRTRLAQFDQTDPEALFALAREVLDGRPGEDYRADAARILREVLRLDPSHRGARDLARRLPTPD